MSLTANRLAGTTSPYLLQHVDNPVHWQPWDDTALGAAREADRPILLSIGYSACHWCHVMAHESFEDAEIAARMNQLFINIKVDREERPDLDQIYQLAHQMMIQRPGGWPLTMFLSPHTLTPFFGGTYFPPEARHGLPGFPELLQRVADYYREHRGDIEQQGEAIRDVFRRIETEAPAGPQSGEDPRAIARAQLERHFDDRWGGFGKAPRFPNAPGLELLLRQWRTSALDEEPDMQALYMAALTLRRMAEGGLNDQLGGGFYRYSVDDYWMIPHFEKMLYDNALLLPVYASASQATGEAMFAECASQTATWMIREMQSPDGGFFSSLDADSEGEEGRFYAWDREEVKSLLGEEDFALFAARYGLDQPANFENRWHLHVFQDLEGLAERHQLEPAALQARLDGARERLFAVREQRVRPALDDKILTAWNGLAIAGLAGAAVSLQEPALAKAATHAVDFLRKHSWRDGRLRVSWRDGQVGARGFLDDYAFLGFGLLRLLEARWRSTDLVFATELAEVLLAHFEDPDHGGFFFTSDEHEELLHRPKPLADNATPAGNAIAISFLGRLGQLLAEARYLAAAERALGSAAGHLAQQPDAHCSLLNAREDIEYPELVVIRAGGETLEQWRKTCQALYAPSRMVVAIDADNPELPPGLADKSPQSTAVAYLCAGLSCQAPVTSLSALTQALAPTARRKEVSA